MKILSIWLCVALLTVSGFALSQETKKYNVSGANADELIASMEANGPGDGAWGSYENRWGASGPVEVTNGKYRFTAINVTYSYSITMPNWPGYRDASACRKRHWDAMYVNLKKHEDKHIDMAKNVASNIKTAAMAITPQDSKAALEAELSVVLNEKTAENQALQDKFDKDTEHGKTDPVNPVILNKCA